MDSTRAPELYKGYFHTFFSWTCYRRGLRATLRSQLANASARILPPSHRPHRGPPGPRQATANRPLVAILGPAPSFLLSGRGQPSPLLSHAVQKIFSPTSHDIVASARAAGSHASLPLYQLALTSCWEYASLYKLIFV